MIKRKPNYKQPQEPKLKLMEPKLLENRVNLKPMALLPKVWNPKLTELQQRI